MGKLLSPCRLVMLLFNFGAPALELAVLDFLSMPHTCYCRW